MKLARFAFAAALAGALALGCGGDEGTGPGGITIADLAGTWDATTATFEGVDGSGFVDVIADGGSVTLTITGDGRFTFVLTLPGESPETASGTMHFEEDFLVMTFDDDPSDPVFLIFLVAAVVFFRSRLARTLSSSVVSEKAKPTFTSALARISSRRACINSSES